MKIQTDLHVHSCLSPCGSMDMDPYDIMGMARISGIQLIALTDHNSAKNCPTAAEAARWYGIGFIPGIEVNTSENIHCVCLFPNVESAMEFDAMLYEHLPAIPNKAGVFGEQRIMTTNGLFEYEYKLLLTASNISIIDLPGLVKQYGGLCWPAHVDREANGLFSVLGTWPEELKADGVEIQERLPEGVPASLKVIQASDAHDMATLTRGGYTMDLESADFAGVYQYITGRNYIR